MNKLCNIHMLQLKVKNEKNTEKTKTKFLLFCHFYYLNFKFKFTLFLSKMWWKMLKEIVIWHKTEITKWIHTSAFKNIQWFKWTKIMKNFRISLYEIVAIAIYNNRYVICNACVVKKLFFIWNQIKVINNKNP